MLRFKSEEFANHEPEEGRTSPVDNVGSSFKRMDADAGNACRSERVSEKDDMLTAITTPEAVGTPVAATAATESPFRKEAVKVLSGNLEERDSLNRTVILNYCEHFRTAYTTKDLDFLRQVFSEDALIIVGNEVKSRPGGMGKDNAAVKRSVRSKREYLQRLAGVFATNDSIGVEFSGFRILKHPSQKGIYGVSLKQKYHTARYSDEGFVFLLWDFRNAAMPLVHVRTWQPAGSADDPIGLGDFDLE